MGTVRHSHTYNYARPGLAYWIALGAVAGAVSVLIFHQGAFAPLNALGVTERPLWSLQPTEPYGIPQVWSLTFWGAVWGAALAALMWRFDSPRVVLASLLLGATLPTLVAWFIVAPLKGLPLAAGYEPLAMAAGLIANGAWGLGTGLGLVLLAGKRRIEHRSRVADRRSADRRRVTGRRANGLRGELQAGGRGLAPAR